MSHFKMSPRRCVFETLSRRDLLAADLNGDQIFDAADIDALVGAINTGSEDIEKFDIDRDGELSGKDIDRYLSAGHANLLRGDVDLDGEVSFQDFLALASSFGQEGGWANGDTNGDGVVGFADFLELANNFGQRSTREVTLTLVDAGHGGVDLLSESTLLVRDLIFTEVSSGTVTISETPGSPSWTVRVLVSSCAAAAEDPQYAGLPCEDHVRQRAEEGDYAQELSFGGSESVTVELPNTTLSVFGEATFPDDPFCFYVVGAEQLAADETDFEIPIFLACA